MYTKALSYSGMRLFKDCPKRWAHKYIDGNKEVSGKAAERGTRIHEQLEAFYKGAPFPSDPVLSPWRRALEALTLYNPVAEGEIAVDSAWNSVKFDAEDAYLRGKIDLAYMDGSTLVIAGNHNHLNSCGVAGGNISLY